MRIDGGEDLESRLEAGPPGGVGRVTSMTDLLEVARHVARSDEVRRTAAGIIGYGATKPGERVLIGVDTQNRPGHRRRGRGGAARDGRLGRRGRFRDGP